MKRKAVFAMLLLAVLLPLWAMGEPTVVKLTCTGDFLPGSNDRNKDKDFSYQHYIREHGYAYPFENLMSLMGSDDITLVNLECPLNDGEPDSESRLTFRGPEEFAAILPACSIEVANLANNHMGNYGKAGYKTTVAALEEAGVKYCGSIQEGSSACFVDVKGVRVGFVGTYPLWNKERPQDLEKCFKYLKENNCDVIIASVHAGMEYRGSHGSMQDNYGDKLYKLGAHIVVGTHSHVPEGIKVFRGVTQLYSLGNSSFGGNTGAAADGVGSPGYVKYKQAFRSVVAQFDLYFEDGVYTGHQLTLWPIHISGNEEDNDYQPVLVGGDEAEKIMQAVQSDTAFRLKPYVEGQGAVQDFVPWPGK